MSVKKSGSYITIPVFDVSWVVNFQKQVSMWFRISKSSFQCEIFELYQYIQIEAVFIIAFLTVYKPFIQ